MITHFKTLFFLSFIVYLSSCVAKKEYANLQTKYNKSQTYMVRHEKDHKDTLNILSMSLANIVKTNQERESFLRNQMDSLTNVLNEKYLKASKAYEKQPNSVGDLMVISKEAGTNIDKTLSQLEQKTKQNDISKPVNTKIDSLNTAVALNLSKVLASQVSGSNVRVEVDKAVIMVNFSEKMLFNSGSAKISAKANRILERIAQIVKSRPELEVIVEGYTDNVAINNDCITDNWDLSVKRATAVVRVLQQTFNIDPNKLIAAGRGETNALMSNATAEGRATNRRTRIILMPKVNQFYDLLNPTKK